MITEWPQIEEQLADYFHSIGEPVILFPALYGPTYATSRPTILIIISPHSRIWNDDFSKQYGLFVPLLIARSSEWNQMAAGHSTCPLANAGFHDKVAQGSSVGVDGQKDGTISFGGYVEVRGEVLGMSVSHCISTEKVEWAITRQRPINLVSNSDSDSNLEDTRATRNQRWIGSVRCASGSILPNGQLTKDWSLSTVAARRRSGNLFPDSSSGHSFPIHPSEFGTAPPHPPVEGGGTLNPIKVVGKGRSSGLMCGYVSKMLVSKVNVRDPEDGKTREKITRCYNVKVEESECQCNCQGTHAGDSGTWWWNRETGLPILMRFAGGGPISPANSLESIVRKIEGMTGGWCQVKLPDHSCGVAIASITLFAPVCIGNSSMNGAM